MAKGELITLGTAAAALGGVYKAGEFLYKAKRLRDVGPSNAVYVRLIGRVRSDLDEVRRLLAVREVHDALEENPEKAKWVYGAIRDVRGALENITPHTERVGGDLEEGRRVGIRHRVYWLLSEKEKLENREKELVVAHASLNEVIGFLTAIEPVKGAKGHHDKEKHEHKHETRNSKTEIDIDIRREAPERERIEREVYIERDGRPRRIEERGRVEEHWVEHEHRGPRYEEREVWVDQHGPRRYEERETYVDHQHYDDRRDNRRYDERELHIERDPHDPRHVEARYTERGPAHFEEKRYEERRYSDHGGRRYPESFEDREPERDSWMQSQSRRGPAQGGRHGEYAEYGAPQPIGAAHYQLPPNREYSDREFWVEEKEDYRYDEYGNRLPDRYFQNVPQRNPPRSRM